MGMITDAFIEAFLPTVFIYLSSQRRRKEERDGPLVAATSKHHLLSTPTPCMTQDDRVPDSFF